MIKRYAVYFEGNCDWHGTKPEVEITGYYAQSQPNYDWSFTSDLNEAKLWKTKRGANAKILHQKQCVYKDLIAKIIEIEISEQDRNIT
jgi:hypothetical protein